MIKNIIFDIGNVLAGFEWQTYLASFNYDEKTATKIANATVLSSVWSEFDRGILSDNEIIRQCSLLAPEYSKEIALFFKNFPDAVVEYEYSATWLQSLKAMGKNIYLLSNYSKTAFEYAKNVFNFYPYADGSVISYEVFKIKPELDIYNILLDKYSLIAEESVFIDDRLENIEAANSLDFKTIHFISKSQVDATLNTILTC